MTPEELLQVIKSKKADAILRALHLYRKMRPNDYKAICMFYGYVE